MPIPSRVLAMGNSGGSTIAICGDGADALVATGSSATDALQLSAVLNIVATTAASTGVKLPPTEAGAEVAVANDGGQHPHGLPSDRIDHRRGRVRVHRHHQAPHLQRGDGDEVDFGPRSLSHAPR
jgi:hypothetical protein